MNVRRNRMQCLKFSNLESIGSVKALVSLLYVLPDQESFCLDKLELSTMWRTRSQINVGFRGLRDLTVHDERVGGEGVSMFKGIEVSNRSFFIELNPSAISLWSELKQLVVNNTELNDWRFIRNRHTLHIYVALASGVKPILQQSDYENLLGTGEVSGILTTPSRKVIMPVRRDFHVLGLNSYLDRIPLI